MLDVRYPAGKYLFCAGQVQLGQLWQGLGTCGSFTGSFPLWLAGYWPVVKFVQRVAQVSPLQPVAVGAELSVHTPRAPNH